MVRPVRFTATTVASIQLLCQAAPVLGAPEHASNLTIAFGNNASGNNFHASPSVTTVALAWSDPLSDTATGNAYNLQLSLVNNLASTNVHAYVTGLDSAGTLVFMQPSGGWVHPSNPTPGVPQAVTADIAILLGSEGSSTNIVLPGYVTSGRVYIADGTLDFFTIRGQSGPALIQPGSVNPIDTSTETNWGFVELTTSVADGVFADLTHVDFVGLPLGLTLENADGTTQSAPGMPRSGVADVCRGLRAQAKIDGQPWDRLCLNDADSNLLRVLSPPNYLGFNGDAAFGDYFTAYVGKV
ncbi:hypothetical protein LTR65_001157 [Meristemomyces frigidus]